MCKTVCWREGSKGDLVSRFARLRVRPPHRDFWRAEPWPEEWLLIEWPKSADAPTKYWLSTLPATTPIATLAVAIATPSATLPSRKNGVRNVAQRERPLEE